MIAVRLEGRLGNQLFQYAFIYAASKKLNTGYYIDQYVEHSIVDKYFQNTGGNYFTQLFKIKGFKNIFGFYLRRSYYRYLALWGKFSIVECDYERTETEIALRNNTIYHGYFQSELFFNRFEELIRDKFAIKEIFVNQFNLLFRSLHQNNSIVTIHIRRADYQNLGHLNLGGDDLSLPLEYYKKAISKFDGQNIHFVFISDDLNFVSQNFKELTNKTISVESEIIDFQHLLNADGCIISNSTFSWWGAWLNKNPDKVVYAPKYFMGWRIKKETPIEIYPKEWIQIEF